MYRIGIGYDLHRLTKRRKLILGGINIAFPKGLLGHSDADVLVHAICDALLGAAGQKDIGEHFPNTQPAYKNISSIELLKKVAQLLQKLKYSIENIDTVIAAERPKLTAYKLKMQRNIAQTLNLLPAQVNIKATTTEEIGAIGQGKAISAYAVALIQKRKTQKAKLKFKVYGNL